MVHLTELNGFTDLAVTLGHVTDLSQRQAPTQEWDALTAALVAEHTQTELADLLIGACALIARAERPIL